MSVKDSNDTIGNRTCDLPACSALPQQTAPPAACPTESIEVDMTDSKSIGTESAPETGKLTERQRKLYNEVNQYSGKSQYIITAIDGVCKTCKNNMYIKFCF
jgi:hypothetical protein